MRLISFSLLNNIHCLRSFRLNSQVGTNPQQTVINSQEEIICSYQAIAIIHSQDI